MKLFIMSEWEVESGERMNDDQAVNIEYLIFMWSKMLLLNVNSRFARLFV